MNENENNESPIPPPLPYPPSQSDAIRVSRKVLAGLVAGGVFLVAVVTVGVAMSIANGDSGSGTTSCGDDLGEYVDALSDLDAELEVGMIQAEYNQEVRGLASAKSAVDESGLDGNCAEAFDLANQAYDTYVAVDDEWNACIVDDYCESDSGVNFAPWDENADVIGKIKDVMSGKGETV